MLSPWGHKETWLGDWTDWLTESLSRVQLFVTQWTLIHQAPLSMEFSRQEYCSRLPLPPPGDLPNPEMEPKSPASPALAGKFFTIGPPGKLPPKNIDIYPQFKMRNSYLYITFFFFMVVRKRAEQKETTEKGWIHSALDKTITKSSWFLPPPSDPSWFSFSKYSFCVLNMFYQYESQTQRIWVWANSKRWGRTGKPGVPKSMGSQRVGHDWATEQ